MNNEVFSRNKIQRDLAIGKHKPRDLSHGKHEDFRMKTSRFFQRNDMKGLYKSAELDTPQSLDHVSRFDPYVPIQQMCPETVIIYPSLEHDVQNQWMVFIFLK